MPNVGAVSAEYIPKGTPNFHWRLAGRKEEGGGRRYSLKRAHCSLFNKSIASSLEQKKNFVPFYLGVRQTRLDPESNSKCFLKLRWMTNRVERNNKKKILEIEYRKVSKDCIRLTVVRRPLYIASDMLVPGNNYRFITTFLLCV